MKSKYKIPKRSSEYINVYKPSGGIYRAPDGKELRKGEFYKEWVPNDHTFIQDEKGLWHILGITHPLTSAKNIHEGELQLFHARAENPGEITEVFKDLGNILQPDERPDEPEEIHSPYIVKKDGLYNMIYGPRQFRLAQSADLENWILKGELFYESEGSSRDPQIMEYENRYYLCYCSANEVRMRQSSDLHTWSEAESILELPDGISPESPFLLNHDGIFYLFLCKWEEKLWHPKTVSGAYQHETLVFAAPEINELKTNLPVGKINAHAGEIINIDGQYFISSVEYPNRGINIARLEFK